jgi:hypothetical protein
MKSAIVCVLGIGIAVGPLGCNKKEASASAPASSAAVTSPASAAPAAEAPPAALQPAKAKMNGKSLSSATMSDIGDALKKQGWSYKSGGGMSMGSTETVTVRATKGKDELKVSVVRPTGKEDTGGMKMSKASAQEASFAKDGATYLEKDAEVLVAFVIEGKKDEAQKLLDAVVEH